MQTMHSRQNSETFDTSHAFLSLVVAKLSDVINSPCFLAHPVYIHSFPKKKPSPLMFNNNFGKCGPIFKILSPGDL